MTQKPQLNTPPSLHVISNDNKKDITIRDLRVNFFGPATIQALFTYGLWKVWPIINQPSLLAQTVFLYLIIILFYLILSAQSIWYAFARQIIHINSDYASYQHILFSFKTKMKTISLNNVEKLRRHREKKNGRWCLEIWTNRERHILGSYFTEDALEYLKSTLKERCPLLKDQTS